MSTQLIAHLKKKCELDPNTKILLSQWEFDQKLVGKALENIAGFYPHFSNHNVSHSQQILINIERILGKDIELLSGTDTWLILEAAYWHDIGMLVDATDAKRTHTDPDFNFMIKMIAGQQSHDLHSFCKAYEESGWAAAIASEDHPFDGVEKYRQLIAEWFRRNHDKRVGSLIEDPFSQLGISSPRTELLPNRLYRYLGQICMSHGMSFEQVIRNLPYKQTGLGVEDCHPRFVGCLLRLGDLFDLDDNRFCPVMAKHVSNMPSVSQCHKDKHLSLREFQLDKRKVKLVAECPDELSYVETQNWFSWIREEFQNQMSQWNLIVPSLDFGSLPTIEQLDVRMRGNKILLGNKPMKFSIDENLAIEILEGSGIYKNDIDIFRELIQNAIDATLMKVWIDSEQGRVYLPQNSHPFETKTRKTLEEYPLKISFIKQEDIDGTDDSWWEFKIEDKGTGISLNDLNYMQKIAGSSRNLERQKIIQRMPKWMRPSGQFGIGLHSAFLLLKKLPDEDQKITIISKNIIDHQLYKIEMNSPLTGRKGYCFIEKVDNFFPETGTQLIVRVKRKRRGRMYSYNPSLIYKSLYKNHDPLRFEAFDLFSVATTVEEVFQKISKNCFLPVNFNDPWQKLIDENLKNSDFDNDFIWVKKYSLYLKINPSFDGLSDLNSGVRAGFKGQEVGGGHLSYHSQPFFFKIMFYGLNAKDTLQTSRNDWKKTFEHDFIENRILHEICQEVILNHSSDLKRVIPKEDIRSLFLYEFGNGLKDKVAWKNLPLFSLAPDSYRFENTKCTFYNKSYNEILDKPKFRFICAEPHFSKFEENVEETDIVFPKEFSYWTRKLFEEDWIDKGGTISYEKRGKFDFITYEKLPVNKPDLCDDRKVKEYIINQLSSNVRRINFNSNWLANKFFDDFTPLFTRSKLVEMLVGFSNLDKSHLILPFHFKQSYTIDDVEDLFEHTKIDEVSVDYLDDDQLIKDTWISRDEEFIDLDLNAYKCLYKDLEQKINTLMADQPKW